MYTEKNWKIYQLPNGRLSRTCFGFRGTVSGCHQVNSALQLFIFVVIAFIYSRDHQVLQVKEWKPIFPRSLRVSWSDRGIFLFVWHPRQQNYPRQQNGPRQQIDPLHVFAVFCVQLLFGVLAFVYYNKMCNKCKRDASICSTKQQNIHDLPINTLVNTGKSRDKC